jgi:peptidoglycan/LPS O-acetylase OafA/YrhL
MSLFSTRSPLSATTIKPYFPALTGLRALAAWLIFFYHFNQFDREGLFGRVLDEFYVGVTLFFVLSGFLICLRYAERIQLSRQWISTYVYHRFARIYPLYLLLTSLSFVICQLVPSYDRDGLYTTSHLPGKILLVSMNLTLLRSWFTHFRFTGIGAGWTLTVEEFFYLLAPFLILGVKRRPAHLPLYAVGL